jgi:hypothetical protein
MPYFNQTLNVYQCYPLLTQGPCEQNEWFVLEETQPNKTICLEKPCLSESNSQDLGDRIISSNSEDVSIDYKELEEDLSFYEVLFNGECKSKDDYKACPSGQELLTNAFGIGKCGFQNNIHDFYLVRDIKTPNNQSCFPQFFQPIFLSFSSENENKLFIGPKKVFPQFWSNEKFVLVFNCSN